ncbi:MAG: leucine-rich repeat domain-containing protein [Treponema sp.]|nr:leucine-rich repeat domain-containing protein [Treponema sp.]
MLTKSRSLNSWTVERKLRTIVENSLQAFLDKELKDCKCDEDFKLVHNTNGINISQSPISEDEYSDDKVLLSLNCKLAAGIEGNISIKKRFSINAIKRLLEIRKHSAGQERINDFIQICSEEGLTWHMNYDSEKICLEATKRIENFSRNIFVIPSFDAGPTCCTIEILLCDDCYLTFQFEYSETYDFIKKFENFIKEVKGKNLNTRKEILTELRNNEFFSYRLVTRNRIKKYLKKHDETVLSLEGIGIRFAENLLENNNRIERVILPEGVKRIPDGMFMNCKKLMSVQLPSSLKEIGKRAFYNCRNLCALNVPKGLLKIEEEAFANCYSLPVLDIPQGCQTDDRAFCTEFDDICGGVDTYELGSNDDYDNSNWY